MLTTDLGCFKHCNNNHNDRTEIELSFPLIIIVISILNVAQVHLLPLYKEENDDVSWMVT